MTMCHPADVYRSYSWSANICGRKKWILYPPGEEAKLKDKDGVLAYDVTSDKSREVDAYSVAVIQEPGEIIFVPSGWHHQVHNLEDTISINHNWVNGCNISIMWDYVCSELESVKNEIQDCRETMTTAEWNQHCQVMMKALCGIDFSEFLHMMRIIAAPRIHLVDRMESDPNCSESHCEGCRKLLQKPAEEVDFLRTKLEELLSNVRSDVSSTSDSSTDHDKSSPSSGMCYFQAIFDLCKIIEVLEKFISNPDVISCSQEQKALRDSAFDMFSVIYNSLRNAKLKL